MHGRVVATSHFPSASRGVFVRRGSDWLIANFHQSVGDARQLGDTWDSMMDTVATEVGREQPPLAVHAAPNGMVTLLFSDIQDSTILAETLGDIEWMKVLREHNTIVRERVAAYEGFEVKTIGDAFMVAYQSARRAVLVRNRHPARVLSLQSRTSGSTGAPFASAFTLDEPIRDSDDFYGRERDPRVSYRRRSKGRRDPRVVAPA